MKRTRTECEELDVNAVEAVEVELVDDRKETREEFKGLFMHDQSTLRRK